MLWAILGSVASHHGDAADPELLIWIKDRLDELANLGPWLVVALIGLVIVAIPVVLVVGYFSQGRPGSSETYQQTGDES
jgi:hypothetical protein